MYSPSLQISLGPDESLGYLHPASAATPRETFRSAASSRERLLSPSSYDIPLRSLKSSSSSIKSTLSQQPSISNDSLTSEPGQTREQHQKPPLLADDHVRALAVTITLALLILIGVPLGAILPQKYVVPLPVNILVPLYIDPVSVSWDRLFEACIKHPNTNFTVILSIDHGPSDTAWPAGKYIQPIKRLHTLPNVQVVGYVDTAYGARSNETVRKEIATYAGWSNAGIAISGIFFDRTPSRDVDGARAYLKNVSATVRHSEGFLDPTLVVHNPGMVPDANMTSYQADLTVIFEGPLQDMPDRKVLKNSLKDLNGRREDYAAVVHAVPRGLSRGAIRKIINGARRDIEWLFVTDREGDKKYESYSNRWEEFLSLTW